VVSNPYLNLEPIKSALINNEDFNLPATELGFVWTSGEALLTFVTSRSFLDDALSRLNIKAILVDKHVELSNITSSSTTRIIQVENAKLNFSRLHNSLRQFVKFDKTQIDKTAQIHPSALIDPIGVKIGKDCVVEAFTSIEAGSTIGDYSIIRSGCRIGTNAMDIKEDEDGNPYMTDHLGGVVIGSHVEIGYNSVVDRAIFRQTATTIGDYTKTSCLVNISHGVRLGNRNRLAAGVKICGSTIVGDDNWFGPGAISSNLLNIGSRNFIALGASVLGDLKDDAKVVGTRVFSDRKLF